jgi:hypothetical protein
MEIHSSPGYEYFFYSDDGTLITTNFSRSILKSTFHGFITASEVTLWGRTVPLTRIT